jgi:hypothetical protein
MKNSSGNREMINWENGLVIFLTLFLCIIFGTAIGYASDHKDNTPQPVQVNLPDGLYLFQPKIMQMYKYRQEIKSDVFSPLFIIKQGKLLDPYLVAKKTGIQKFMKEYVTKKSFNVYVGTEMIGKLSDVKLRFFETDTCPSGRLLFDIEGTGRYEGKPLPGSFEDKSVYAGKNNELLLNLAIMKAVATPQAFYKSKKMESFTVTEDDKKGALSEFQKNKILISDAIRPLKERISQENGTIIGEKAYLSFIKIADLDDNGKKDGVGEFGLNVTFTRTSGYKKHESWIFSNNMFVLFDTGKIEKVLIGSMMYPAFSLSGLIDIDQNGVQELIVQISSGPYVEDDNTGKRIEIFQHDSSGWKSIYRSELICSQIN